MDPACGTRVGRPRWRTRAILVSQPCRQPRAARRDGRPSPRGRRVDAVVPCYADGDGRQPHRHRPRPGRWRAGRLSCHTAADAHGHVHGGRHVRTHRSPDAGGHGACAGHLDGSSDANGRGVHDRVRRNRRRPDVGTGWRGRGRAPAGAPAPGRERTDRLDRRAGRNPPPPPTSGCPIPCRSAAALGTCCLD